MLRTGLSTQNPRQRGFERLHLAQPEFTRLGRVRGSDPCFWRDECPEDLVSMKHRLRTLLMCLPLLIGSVVGVPMRPEQIEELLQNTRQQKVADIIPDESENGDGTIRRDT